MSRLIFYFFVLIGLGFILFQLFQFTVMISNPMSRMKRDLVSLKSRLETWRKSLIKFDMKDLGNLSAKFDSQKGVLGMNVLKQGTLNSVFYENYFTYAMMYYRGINRRLLLIQSSNLDFVYSIESKFTEVSIDGEKIGYINDTFQLLDENEQLLAEIKLDNVLEYNNDKIAGSYKFLDNNNLIDFAAVNIDPSESILEKLTDDQLTKYYTDLVGDNYLMLNPKEDFLQKITKARYGTELWKLFLLLAFLLALIEMFISRSAKKDLMNLGQN